MAEATPNRKAERTRHEILLFVRGRIAAGAPPTVREVQEHCGFRAVESARRHLEGLVAAGLLAKEPGRARGYRLPGPAGRALGAVQLVPRLGRVQAGALSEAIEDLDGYVPVEGVAAGDELFALTVRGESMNGAGILPGDTVIVRRQETARDGEVVVALVRDEATVKRLRLRAGRVELHPENPAFRPIVPGDGIETRILGRVVEVRRFLA